MRDLRVAAVVALAITIAGCGGMEADEDKYFLDAVTGYAVTIPRDVNYCKGENNKYWGGKTAPLLTVDTRIGQLTATPNPGYSLWQTTLKVLPPTSSRSVFQAFENNDPAKNIANAVAVDFAAFWFNDVTGKFCNNTFQMDFWWPSSVKGFPKQNANGARYTPTEVKSYVKAALKVKNPAKLTTTETNLLKEWHNFLTAVNGKKRNCTCYNTGASSWQP